MENAEDNDEKVVILKEHYPVNKIKARLYELTIEIEQATDKVRIRMERDSSQKLKILLDEKRELEQSLDKASKALQTVDRLRNNLPNVAKYRVERNIGAYPLWSTSRAKQTEKYKYTSANGKYWIEVEPSPYWGQATAKDAAIIHVLLSIAKEIYQKSEILTFFIPITRYELLKRLKLSNSGKNYRELAKSLKRLRSTNFEGNIFGQTNFSGTLISYMYEDDEHGPEKLVFSLNPLLLASLKSGILIDVPDEIILDDGLLRKEIATRVWIHLGKQQQWQVRLDHLARMVNFTEAAWRLKQLIVRHSEWFERWFQFDFEKRNKTVVAVWSRKERLASSIVPE